MKKIILAAGLVALAFSLAACGASKTGSPSGTPTAAESVASALATSAAVQQVKADLAKCWPAGVIAQAHEVHLLAKDTPKHPNGSAAALAACMHVSKAEEKPFVNDVLNAGEHALVSGQLSTSSGRKEFVTKTLLPIAAKYDGAVTASPSPSCSHVSSQGSNQGMACASVKP